MDYGIIDLGSNTIRLSIFKYTDKSIKLITNKKIIVGLAAYVKDGGLTSEGIERACAALNKLKETLVNSNVENYSVFATASLRNINNRETVLNTIKEKTGLTPEILFGDEEARLDFIGLSSSCSLDRGVLVDIGGGSTEIVLFENAEIKRLASIPLGALNIQNRYTYGITPDEKEIKKMKKIINTALNELKWECENDYQQLYAIGGTSRASLEVAKELYDVPVENNSFTRFELKSILKKLKSEEPEEYKTVYRIIPDRIFSFAGGITILNEIAKKFGCETITISKNGIREGYFIDRVINKSGCDKNEPEKEI